MTCAVLGPYLVHKSINIDLNSKATVCMPLRHDSCFAVHEGYSAPAGCSPPLIPTICISGTNIDMPFNPNRVHYTNSTRGKWLRRSPAETSYSAF